MLNKVAGYRFHDLELGFALTGIHIELDPKVKPVYDYYHIENCFFHDIANPIFPPTGSSPVEWWRWAFAIRGDGGGRAKNITVKNCIGLRTQGFLGIDSKDNLSFDGNTVAHTSLNQVSQSEGKHQNITNCVFVYNYPWTFDKWGTTQVIAGGLRGGDSIRNEVINNEFGWPGDYPGSPDGCGYDFETSTSDVTFKNNFVHDSYGEAILFMGDRVQKNLIFDGNILRNNVRFSPRWDCTISLPLNVTGNGVFSNNVFYLWPGKKAFSSKPDCFTYVNNDERPTRPFAAMPLVSHISYGAGSRTYALECATPGATIRYTMDGSLPNSSSAVYTRPIRVKRSCALNAKAFKEGYYNSYVNSLVVEMRIQEGRFPSAWWKLDEKSGITARDSAGGNDGFLDGATRTASRIGPCLWFHGSGSGVNLKHAGLAAIADTFTIAFWANPEAARPSTPEVNRGIGLTGTAWWKLDEGTGDTVADANGGPPGTITGCTWTNGKFGHALRFNGSSNFVNLNNAGLKAVSDSFTVSFWANPEATRAVTPEANAGISGTSDQRYALEPAQYSDVSGSAGVGVSVGTNGVSVFELADNYMPSLLVSDRPLSGWNQIVVVYQDNQPSLYINGSLVRTGLKSARRVHPNFRLGGGPYGWYKGELDDVRVYPRALTEIEVRQLSTRGEEAEVAWMLDKMAGATGLPYALAPISRGGGSDADHAGVGVAVGTTGISVCESSDDYMPSLLVDSQRLTGWNHITVVYRDRQPTLYLNGVFEKAGCRSAKTVHPVFNMGGGDGVGRYVGKLGDIRVYNRSLTDAEIQELASRK